MSDRPIGLAVLLVLISGAMLLPSNLAADLFAERVAHVIENSSVGAADLPLALAAMIHGSFGGDASIAVTCTSLIGWAVGAMLLLILPRTRSDAVLMMHPASLLLTAAGAGLAAFGLVALFGAIRRAAFSRAMVDLPVVGLAMALAALSVPEFERLVLPLASALFLTAPPAMLERQVLSYYLIVFLPALTILGLAAGMGRDVMAGLGQPSAGTGPNLAVAAVTVPSIAWVVTSQQTRRLAAVLMILALAWSLGGRSGLDWPLLAAALAGASAVRGRYGPWPEVLGALATWVVAAFLALEASPFNSTGLMLK